MRFTTVTEYRRRPNVAKFPPEFNYRTLIFDGPTLVRVVYGPTRWISRNRAANYIESRKTGNSHTEAWWHSATALELEVAEELGHKRPFHVI